MQISASAGGINKRAYTLVNVGKNLLFAYIVSFPKSCQSSRCFLSNCQSSRLVFMTNIDAPVANTKKKNKNNGTKLYRENYYQQTPQ